MNKELVSSLAQAAIEVNSKISAMSLTYDALVAEFVAVKKELEELKSKDNKPSKKKD